MYRTCASCFKAIYVHTSLNQFESITTSHTQHSISSGVSKVTHVSQQVLAQTYMHTLKANTAQPNQAIRGLLPKLISNILDVLGIALRSVLTQILSLLIYLIPSHWPQQLWHYTASRQLSVTYAPLQKQMPLTLLLHCTVGGRVLLLQAAAPATPLHTALPCQCSSSQPPWHSAPSPSARPSTASCYTAPVNTDTHTHSLPVPWSLTQISVKRSLSHASHCVKNCIIMHHICTCMCRRQPVCTLNYAPAPALHHQALARTELQCTAFMYICTYTPSYHPQQR